MITTPYDYMDQIMPMLADMGGNPSLCSIQAPETPDDNAAPSGNYVPVLGLQNIPCRDAPDTFGGGLSATEVKALDETASLALRHVRLDKYYTQLSPSTNWGNLGWKAILNGVSYDILGAEADSAQIMTRIKLRRVTV